MSDESHDTLREQVIAEAERQQITAYAIAKLLGNHPGPEAVKRYLMGRCHLGTQHVSRICSVLGLELRRKRK